MTKSEQLKARLLDVKNKFLTALPKNVETINLSWSELREADWNVDTFSALQNIVHQIAGNAGSFGYHDLTNRARTLDETARGCIAEGRAPSVSEQHEIEDLLKEINQITTTILQDKSAEETPAIAKEANADLKLKVLIVDDDPIQVEYVSAICKQAGCQVAFIKQLANIDKALSKWMPHLILLDIEFPDNHMAGINAAERLKLSIGFNIPILFMSSRTDIKARMQAMRAGGIGYMTKPIDEQVLVNHLKRTKENFQPLAKLLMVDDDPLVTSLVSGMLSAHGFQVDTLNEPLHIIERLQATQYDVLLLDLNMPNLSGDSILQMLRQDAAFFHLPVIFLTADVQEKTQNKLYSLGANDFLGKPVDETKLLTSLHSVLGRSRSLQELVKTVTKSATDSIAVNKEAFYSRLEEEMTQTEADERSTLLMNITVKNLDYVRYRIGITKLGKVTESLSKKLMMSHAGIKCLTELAPLNYLLLVSVENVNELESQVREILNTLLELTVDSAENTLKLDPVAGVVAVGNNQSSVDMVLQRAEQLCSASLAKKAPSPQFEIDSSLTAARQDNWLREQIKRCIANESVSLLYQPVIDFEFGNKIFETLARMYDEDGNMIRPDQFLRELTDGKSQAKFNRSLIKQAVEDITSIKGLDAQSVSVIIKPLFPGGSPLELSAWLSNLMKSSNIRGTERLIFALPESSMLTDTKPVAAFLDIMKQLSLGIMMEGAGETEHTLALVKEFGIRRVKLAKSIVSQLLDDDAAAKDKLKQFQAAKVSVIAPCVESAPDFALLWSLGIRQFQGYFVRPPEQSLDFDFESAIEM